MFRWFPIRIIEKKSFLLPIPFSHKIQTLKNNLQDVRISSVQNQKQKPFVYQIAAQKKKPAFQRRY